jgi:hypothetical protein
MVMYMVMLIFTMVQLLALLVLRVFLLARERHTCAGLPTSDREFQASVKRRHSLQHHIFQSQEVKHELQPSSKF